MNQTTIESHETQATGKLANPSKIQDPEQLLDVPQAAALLSVKPKTLYAWVSRNQVPYRKLGSLVRFHRIELIAWTRASIVR
ncbi:MAG: Helix-turn-helix domain [Blastocatellia bacterium]|jgi:excisionase family DNA binding protein|nr:Helix-turn-helix domain [Blastocatellia bacterium]